MQNDGACEDGYTATSVNAGLSRDAGESAHLAALGSIGLGAITLDRQGRVLHCNAAVQLGDGLEMIRSEPRASHCGDQPALAAAIGQALAMTHDDPGRRPLRVALRRPSGRRALVVGLLPLAAAPASLSAAALMLITDLDQALPPAVEELRRLFDLTPREAELAASLATGVTLDEAAARIGISVAHARQRLKVVFMKTQTHRQPALVALLARLGMPQG